MYPRMVVLYALQPVMSDSHPAWDFPFAKDPPVAGQSRRSFLTRKIKRGWCGKCMRWGVRRMMDGFGGGGGGECVNVVNGTNLEYLN